MDNKLLLELLMANDTRRKLIEDMAASIMSASAIFGRSQDEILNMMNIMIKAELEKHKEFAQIFERSMKQLKEEYGIDEDKL
mgnify:CR=1 FL=1